MEFGTRRRMKRLGMCSVYTLLQPYPHDTDWMDIWIHTHIHPSIHPSISPPPLITKIPQPNTNHHNDRTQKVSSNLARQPASETDRARIQGKRKIGAVITNKQTNKHQHCMEDGWRLAVARGDFLYVYIYKNINALLTHIQSSVLDGCDKPDSSVSGRRMRAVEKRYY